MTEARQINGELLGQIDTERLAANVERILQDLRQHCPQGYAPAKLLAVTKNVSPQVINKLLALGVTEIAESRVQAALPKLCYLSPNYRLHWIGRLQTNKVKTILPHISLLHSMDRMELAQEVNRRAGEAERVLPILVQVNIAGESQKAGIDPAQLKPFLKTLRGFACLSVNGLMAIMPRDADAECLRGLFRNMRSLFDSLREEAIDGISMEHLSMGMSNDYLLAAQEGATMVRIGTALYR